MYQIDVNLDMYDTIKFLTCITLGYFLLDLLK